MRRRLVDDFRAMFGRVAGATRRKSRVSRGAIRVMPEGEIFGKGAAQLFVESR